MHSPSTDSLLSQNSTQKNKRRRKYFWICVCFAELLLLLSCLVLLILGYVLGMMEITALVGQSIPQVTWGLAVLAIVTLLYGRLSDYRRWRTGFYIQSLCLIILGLSEGFIVLYSFFQYSERKTNQDFWDDLDDDGKSLIMAKWQCCGWSSACTAEEGIYWYYRAYIETLCYDATASDYKDWNNCIFLYFSLFAAFHLLYTCFPCVCQAARKRKSERIKIKEGFREKSQQEENPTLGEEGEYNAPNDIELVISNNTREDLAYGSQERSNEEVKFSSAPSSTRNEPLRSDIEERVSRESIRMDMSPGSGVQRAMSFHRGANENKSFSEHDDSGPDFPPKGLVVDIPRRFSVDNEASVIEMEETRGKHRPNNISIDSNRGGTPTASAISASAMPWNDYEQPKAEQILETIPSEEESKNSSGDNQDEEDTDENTSKRGSYMDDAKDLEKNVEQEPEGQVDGESSDDAEMKDVEVEEKSASPPKDHMGAEDAQDRGDDNEQSKDKERGPSSTPVITQSDERVADVEQQADSGIIDAKEDDIDGLTADSPSDDGAGSSNKENQLPGNDDEKNTESNAVSEQKIQPPVPPALPVHAALGGGGEDEKAQIEKGTLTDKLKEDGEHIGKEGDIDVSDQENVEEADPEEKEVSDQENVEEEESEQRTFK